MKLEIHRRIIPNRMKYKNSYSRITSFKSPYKFQIRDYTIFITEGIVVKVKTDSPHPNKNPETGNFCIPEGMEFDRKHTPVILETMFRTFNLDDCYFTPWTEFTYD